MAFLSRLFKRGDPLAEREEARRQGMRDARRHPLTTFTDPGSRPAFVAEVRAHAREQITEAGRRLAALRGELLERAMAAREEILLELDRTDLLPQPPPEGDAAPERSTGEDAFISIAEARWRREEARRREAVRRSQENVQRAGARISQCAQEWENALIEHDHEVAAVHARAEQLIAAYRSGVMETHPRREEIPPLWQGEVIAVEPTADSRLGISGREEMRRLVREIDHRVTEWRTRVLPPGLPASSARPHLPPGPEDAVDSASSQASPVRTEQDEPATTPADSTTQQPATAPADSTTQHPGEASSPQPAQAPPPQPEQDPAEQTVPRPSRSEPDTGAKVAADETGTAPPRDDPGERDGVRDSSHAQDGSEETERDDPEESSPDHGTPEEGGRATVPLRAGDPVQGNGVIAGEPRRERQRTYSWREAFGDPSRTVRTDPPGDAGSGGEERSWPR